MSNYESAASDNARLDRVRRIVQQIAELEAELENEFGGEVDAVLLPTAAPLLLRQTQQELLKAQEELRRANETLEQRVAERTEELEVANEELQQTMEELQISNHELVQKQEQLRESEEKYRTLFDSIDEGYCIIEVLFDDAGKPVDYRFVEVNPAFERHSGLHDAVGQRMREMVPAHEEHWFQVYGQVARTGESVRFENQAAALHRWYDVYAFRFGQPEQRLVAVLFNDITERKRAEAERERLLADVERRAAELDATLDSIADGLVIYDTNGQAIRTNAAAERILQYTPGERGLAIPERAAALRVEHPDGTPFTSEETPAMRALRGETVSGEIMVVHRPHGTIWTTVSAAPIRVEEGAIQGVVVVFTDITSLHDLQEQQRILMHMVSHDLRTPLTIIQGHAELMADQVGKDTPLGKDVEAIHRNTLRLNAMIEDLTDTARLEGGQIELAPAPVSPAAYLPELLERLSPALDVGRVHLDVPEGLPPMLADTDRLDRIMTNLLSNAFKYSDPGTPVEIHARRNDGEVAISITDHGPGIAPEELPHLFQRFYRAKSHRKAEGIGLGLYITRLLVEAHGGRIRAESALGEGSTFTFTLPEAK
jgi:PAS domain S-box-containing protein